MSTQALEHGSHSRARRRWILRVIEVRSEKIISVHISQEVLRLLCHVGPNGSGCRRDFFEDRRSRSQEREDILQVVACHWICLTPVMMRRPLLRQEGRGAHVADGDASSDRSLNRRLDRDNIPGIPASSQMFPCRHEIKWDPARACPSVHVLCISDGLAKAALGQLPTQALRLGVGAACHHAIHIRGDAGSGEWGIGLEKWSDRPADENHARGEVTQVHCDGGHAVDCWTAWCRHAADAANLSRITSRASFRSRARPTRSASTSAKLWYTLGQRRGSSAARGYSGTIARPVDWPEMLGHTRTSSAM